MFTPTSQEVEHTRRVFAAGEAGAGVVDGEMVDAVHLTLARSVLTRAGETT